ncbi:hypothetical protein E4191_06195 [Paracoccus liaowanqingii]|uniref:Anti-sigma factor n=1 Tax=Paracoccus liaowanqingii TaxID=2560053 RepID=A0A4P7HM21_9RHOB|nr:hypothetical protein [Paracoccus liaowanqingii]QBX34347.1 hypothetical protein E4191_06195 [Paracoccus liaowanqingii]
MSIDDITLMALADGELDAAEARALQARIAADPQAQARLAQFRLTRAHLAALAEDASAHPGDADLTARIRAAGIAAHPPSGRPIPRPAANRNRAPWAALAAGLAVLGIAIGWWLPGGNSGSDGLQEVLARVPAGEGAMLEDGTDVTVIASFRTGTGQLCREIETAGDGRARLAILCRDDASEAFEERFALDLTTAEGYQPASGELEGLDAFLAGIGAGDPLSPADEAEALAP